MGETPDGGREQMWEQEEGRGDPQGCSAHPPLTQCVCVCVCVHPRAHARVWQPKEAKADREELISERRLEGMEPITRTYVFMVFSKCFPIINLFRPFNNPEVHRAQVMPS